jgi:RimJ/RimL family protein N-acetyltransferase
MPPIPLPDPELADEVIRLRPPEDRDVPALHAACQDPGIAHFTFVPTPYTEAHARAWVAGNAQDRERGIALGLAIVSATDDDALLGTVGAIRPDWEHRLVELGYWVAPEARGRGIAARALGLLGPWAIKAMDMARLSLHIDAANAASRRTAERAGFTFEGVERSSLETKGRRWDLAVYSLLPEDLAA